MKSLLLVAMMVFSSQLAAKSPKKPIARVMEGLKAIPQLKELSPGMINRLAQIMIDEEKPNVSLLLHYINDDVQVYDLSKARDEHGIEIPISAKAVLLENTREKLIKQLLHSGEGLFLGKYYTKNKGGDDIRRIFTLPYEFKDGEATFDEVVALSIRNSGNIKEISNLSMGDFIPVPHALEGVAAAATTSAQTEVVTMRTAVANLAKVLEQNNMTDDVRSEYEDFRNMLQARVDQQDTEATAAISAAMANEELIWIGDSLTWQDFASYIEGRKSSSALIKSALTEEEINVLDTLLLDDKKKIEQHLNKQAVLSNADFKILCQNSILCWGYRAEENGLPIDKMLAIERVLAVHEQSVAKLSDDGYLKTMDSSLEQSVHTLITEAGRVYRGQLKQPVVYDDLPDPKPIEDNQEESLPEYVQKILDVLDGTEHILYTDTFVDWLKKLTVVKIDKKSIDEIALVQKRLEMWARLPSSEILRVVGDEKYMDAIRGLGEKEKNANKLLEDTSGIIEDKWPEIVDERKLRLNYAEYEGKVVLLNGLSGHLKEGKQKDAINQADDIFTDKKKLAKQIQASVQAKEEARQED